MSWEPKIRKMNWFVWLLTWGWASAITLLPFGIFMKEKYFPPYYGYDTMSNHEKIHWKQQLEMMVAGAIIALITGIILLSFQIFSWWLLLLLLFPFSFFYLWYFIEWIIKTILPPWRSEYCRLGFEREAHLHDNNLDYLKTRKHFFWMKYMFHENVKYLKQLLQRIIR